MRKSLIAAAIAAALLTTGCGAPKPPMPSGERVPINDVMNVPSPTAPAYGVTARPISQIAPSIDPFEKPVTEQSAPQQAASAAEMQPSVHPAPPPLSGENAAPAAAPAESVAPAVQKPEVKPEPAQATPVEKSDAPAVLKSQTEEPVKLNAL